MVKSVTVRAGEFAFRESRESTGITTRDVLNMNAVLFLT